MTNPAQFLTSLVKVFAAMNLYKEGHPARQRAIEEAFEKVRRLQEEDPRPEFTFLGDEVIYKRRPVSDLKNWPWAARLARVGAQRLEFTGPVTLPDFEVFVEEIMALLSGQPMDTAEARQTRPTHIRWGTVGLRESGEGGAGAAKSNLAAGSVSFSLTEETEAIQWIHEELRDRKTLHLLEAEAIVRSMSVAMHGDQHFLIPLLKLKRFDQYTTTHAMNVSVLSMALAEFVGLGPSEVRAFGIAGLLHDLGKITIPDEILNKPGKLTDDERAVMNNHTTAGARIIMETEQNLDLAAVVAYEHHIRINGGGYPTLTYPRACHQASNMVHVCDVFDALRTHRPYRDAWEQERVVDYIQEGAGSEFDSELATAFVAMINQWSDRIAILTTEDEALPIEEDEVPPGPEPKRDGNGAGEGTPEGGNSEAPITVNTAGTPAKAPPAEPEAPSPSPGPDPSGPGEPSGGETP